MATDPTSTTSGRPGPSSAATGPVPTTPTGKHIYDNVPPIYWGIHQVIAIEAEAAAMERERLARSPEHLLGEIVDKIAATTSGFDASGGVVTVGQESEPDTPGLVVDAVPAPADHAGARAGTSRQDASDPDAGATEAHSEPTPAPRCDGFNKELGACVRKAGHTANHQAKDGQSWA